MPPGKIQSTPLPFKLEAKTVEVTTDEYGVATIYFDTTFDKVPIVTITPFAYKETVDTEEVTYYPKVTILEVTTTYVKIKVEIGQISTEPSATETILVPSTTDKAIKDITKSTATVLSDVTPSKELAVYDVDASPATVVSDVTKSTKQAVYDVDYDTTTVLEDISYSTVTILDDISYSRVSAYRPTSYAYWRIVDDPVWDSDTSAYDFRDYTAREYWLYTTTTSTYYFVTSITRYYEDVVDSISRYYESVVDSITEYKDYFVYDISKSTTDVVDSITLYTDYFVYDISKSTTTVLSDVTPTTITVGKDPISKDIPTSDHFHVGVSTNATVVTPSNVTIKLNYIAIEPL